MLSSAKKLLEKRFRKPWSIKTSLWYTMNTTNNKQEALIHAQINKYNDPNEMGAVVERLFLWYTDW